MGILQFATFITVVLGVLYMMHFVVLHSLQRVFTLTSPLWMIALVALPLAYLVSVILIHYYYCFTTRLLYTIGSVWLGIIFLLFSVFILYEIAHILTGWDSKPVVIALLVLSLSTALYGLLHARTVEIKTVPVTISTLSHPLTIVQLSDIHVGTINSTKYLERLIVMTNELNPDIILITGDLFDGSGPVVSETLSPLNDFNAPAYLSIGNHEFYEGLPMVRKTIDPLKLTLLENEMVEIEGIQLLAINDPTARSKTQSAKSILDSLSVDLDKPSILMHHTPVEWNSAVEAGIDLQVSGHTHNGQIIPFNVPTKIAYTYIKGLYKKNGSYLYTSPGTGTWGPPMRIGSTNEITLFKLVPLKTAD